MELYLTVDDVAVILQTSPNTIRKYLREDKLKAYKVGKNWKIKQRDLEQFIELNCNKA